MSKWQIIKVKYPLKEGCSWTVFGERDAWIAFGTFEEAKGYVWSRLAAALSLLPERMAAYSQGRIGSQAPPFSSSSQIGNQGQALLNLRTLRIESRITGGHERVLENRVADECAPSPPHPGMTVALSQVEHARLSDKET